MHVDQALVRHIARLARIQVSDDEAKSLEGELSAILDWVEQLSEVDTTDVEPLTSVIDVTMKQRDDEVTDGGYPDTVVENAAEKVSSENGHFFMVPKVVE